MSSINPRDIGCDGCGQPAGKRCLTGSPYVSEQHRKPTGTHLARRADAYWETLRTDARDAPAGTPLADAYDAALRDGYLARSQSSATARPPSFTTEGSPGEDRLRSAPD